MTRLTVMANASSVMYENDTIITLSTDYNETGKIPKTTFYIWGEFCHKYLLPVVILTGLVGNTLSILVFLRTHLRTLSSSVYLAALSVADTGFLLQLSISWLGYFKINLIHTNGPCQASVYLSYVCSFLSVWLVVSFTVERYIAVCYPLHRPKVCTTKRARIVVICLSVFAMVAYCYVAWTSGIQNNLCVCIQKYCAIISTINNVDTVITLIIPSLLIIIMNVRIVCRIASSNDKSANLLNTHHPLAERRSSPSEDRDHSNMPLNRTPNNVTYVRHRTQMKITKMLLVVSTMFLVLNLPSHVVRMFHFIGEFVDSRYLTNSPKLIRQWQQLFIFIYYCNFSVNFFLYSLCGKNFRKALRLLCQRPKRNMHYNWPLTEHNTM